MPDRACIPLDQCQHQYLYYVHGPNFSFGVYDSIRQGFVGIRHKLDASYVCFDYYSDGSDNFGASPVQSLEPCPIADLHDFEANLGDNIQINVISTFKTIMANAKATKAGIEIRPPPEPYIVNRPLHEFLLAAEAYYDSIVELYYNGRITIEWFLAELARLAAERASEKSITPTPT